MCAVPNCASDGWGMEVSFLDLFVVWENYSWGDATHVTCPRYGVHDGRSTDTTQVQLDELMSILLWAVWVRSTYRSRNDSQTGNPRGWRVSLPSDSGVNLFHATCWFLLFLNCWPGLGFLCGLACLSIFLQFYCLLFGGGRGRNESHRFQGLPEAIISCLPPWLRIVSAGWNVSILVKIV